jgi:hypothetical protein
MKKVVVLLLVLTFGFTAAYADGVSFGAWTRTIYNVAAGSTDPNVNINQNIGPNWWAEGAPGQGLYASLSLNVKALSWDITLVGKLMVVYSIPFLATS